ncbi:RNA polymerase sigma factor [Clostridium nigeriense]|uniref:RNA polymerase sigma factor n=1 Tax=Clostridium nigeriense TaxID=1805470 RepID=UPI003D3330CD
MSELEFIQCLNEITNGNKNALKIIYDNYGYLVYTYALSIVQDKHIAEDVCQEVFIKVWSNSGKYNKSFKTKAWIMTITKNTAIDYLRKNKKESITREIDIVWENSGVENLGEKLEIYEALNMLQSEEKEVIILHLLSDLTFKSISKIMNKPLGTVTWRYRDGIKKLKNIINF